jgi:L-lysine exporter family protein LysE/ArgO
MFSFMKEKHKITLHVNSLQRPRRIAMLNNLLAGFFTGLTLIVAIGAQNAFVMRQGLKRQHVLTVIVICILSDILLISCGVMGLGSAINSHQVLQSAARFGGAAFLLVYGLQAARRTLSAHRMEIGLQLNMSRKAAILSCLAFTYLNPHVYLDTVVLLGALANQRPGSGAAWFGAGACIASVCWYIALGYGSGKLVPLFARERTWRIFDGAVSVMMLGMGLKLAVG